MLLECKTTTNKHSFNSTGKRTSDLSHTRFALCRFGHCARYGRVTASGQPGCTSVTATIALWVILHHLGTAKKEVTRFFNDYTNKIARCAFVSFFSNFLSPPCRFKWCLKRINMTLKLSLKPADLTHPPPTSLSLSLSFSLFPL